MIAKVVPIITKMTPTMIFKDNLSPLQKNPKIDVNTKVKEFVNGPDMDNSNKGKFIIKYFELLDFSNL